jgi:hypothetical protein
LKHVDEFTTKAKTKGASPWPTCILDTLNKFLNVLMHELPQKKILVMMLIKKLKWCPGQHHLLKYLIG